MFSFGEPKGSGIKGVGEEKKLRRKKRKNGKDLRRKGSQDEKGLN